MPNQHLPKYAPGTALTREASAAITAGQLLTITGDNTVAPTTGDAQLVVGVASRDAAIGELLTVQRGGVHVLTAAAAVAAGDYLMSAAGGQVRPVPATAATGAATTQTQTDINNTRAIVGYALEPIALGAAGECHLNT